MQISLNGEPREVAPDTVVAKLVADLGLVGRRLAVEVNGDVVPKTRHAQHALADGDQVEIVHAIGGG